MRTQAFEVHSKMKTAIHIVYGFGLAGIAITLVLGLTYRGLPYLPEAAMCFIGAFLIGLVGEFILMNDEE